MNKCKAVAVVVFAMIVSGCAAMSGGSGQTSEHGHFVYLEEQDITFMRCPLGQVWNGGECDRSPHKGNPDFIRRQIIKLNAATGENWRQPSIEEFLSILECSGKKLDYDKETNFSSESVCRTGAFSNTLAMEKTLFPSLESIWLTQDV